MTILDYGFANHMNTYIKIQGDTVTCKDFEVTGITFRGYPMLRMDDLVLEDCSFENCGTVYFSDCKVSNCRFCGIETVYADRTPIDGCDFEHLRCDNDCVLCLEDSKISHCAFKDVELTDEAYLVNGAGDVWIESCSFENISTDRADRELFFCEETVGKIFKKKVQFCIADTSSCSGLERVKCTAQEKQAAEPIDGAWLLAVEQGIKLGKSLQELVMRR